MSRFDLPDFSAARGRHLLVAVSGGADSVALLCLLAERRDALALTLTAAHVEHGIRGAESLADAEYCRALCRRLGVPLRIAHVDVPALARETGEGIETASPGAPATRRSGKSAARPAQNGSRWRTTWTIRRRRC